MALGFLSPEGESLREVHDNTCALIGMGKLTWTAEVIKRVKFLLEDSEKKLRVYQGVTDTNFETIHALLQHDSLRNPKNPNFIGILPVSNSQQGPVQGVGFSLHQRIARGMDLFTPGDFLLYPNHQLAFVGDILEITEIHTHPQAFAQTFGRDETLMKQVFGVREIKFVAQNSTQVGALKAKREPKIGTLCTPSAANAFNLNIYERNSDLVDPESRTRFRILCTTRETATLVKIALDGKTEDFQIPTRKEIFAFSHSRDENGMGKIMDFFGEIGKMGIDFVPLDVGDHNQNSFSFSVSLEQDVSEIKEIATSYGVELVFLQQSS